MLKSITHFPAILNSIYQVHLSFVIITQDHCGDQLKPWAGSCTVSHAGHSLQCLPDSFPSSCTHAPAQFFLFHTAARVIFKTEKPDHFSNLLLKKTLKAFPIALQVKSKIYNVAYKGLRPTPFFYQSYFSSLWYFGTSKITGQNEDASQNFPLPVFNKMYKT